jgi:hypothetical protein
VVCSVLALLGLCGVGRGAEKVPAPVYAVPAVAASVSRLPDITGKDYFATTPQLADPLRPLANLSSKRVRVRAMVATIPDPVETHLGRSFDMALAATISGFQSQNYVLNGYAFPWTPPAPVKPGEREKSEPEDERTYRRAPGVLLFRRDAWRGSKFGRPPDYALVFLVGESPSYGVQRDAFDVAARCAMHLDRLGPTDVALLRVDRRCDTRLADTRDARLDVLGPSFSGSMQSLALAIQALRNDTRFARIDALLLSASATVNTNRDIDKFLTVDATRPHARGGTSYIPLAWPLIAQYRALRSYLCTLPSKASGRKVIIFAEESSFGRDAQQLTAFDTRPEFMCENKSDETTLQVDVRWFPPNIASIRAEHSIERSAEEAQIPGLAKARGRLLELDMTSAREGMDRPTVYEPDLTSRSDELMLYRTFDSLHKYVKPDVVVIIATDVRDRLFLLSQVRQHLPDALPVMMELDFLAIHPDYRKGSRGAVVVPAGDAVVCTDERNNPLACAPSKDKKGWPRTYSFATDFAANVFRATSLLLRWHEHRAVSRTSFNAFFGAELYASSRASPCLYVATLAGFQELDFPGLAGWTPLCRNATPDGGKPRSAMAAAETRLAAQMPAFVALALLSAYFMVVSVWVIVDQGRGRVFLSAMRYVVFDGRWIKGAWDRLRAHAREKFTAPVQHASAGAQLPHGPPNEFLSPHRVTVLMLLLWLISNTALSVSLKRLIQVVDGDVALAHGRDFHALVAIWLIYICVCILGFARLKVADHRLGKYVAQFVKAISRPDPYRHPTLAWLLPVIVAIIALLVVFRQNVFLLFELNSSGLPLSVDSGLPWLVALLVLAFGIAFLVNAARLLRLICRITLFISGATPGIRAYLREKDWPAPQVIHQAPQTPFNLSLNRVSDIDALSFATPDAWAALTCELVDRGAKTMALHEALPSGRFEEWQAQLVAELKLYVVAMRTCVWCAMLAPIAVLMAMSTYPPLLEPRMTMIAIVQLVASFGYGVYLVLRMEQDMMLGPMFTRTGDQLTFGGSLRALWPKFLAMGIVLVPLVMPDVWRWLLGIVRSINSFT